MIKILQYTSNPFQENAYIVYDEESATCMVIDPGCYTRREKEEFQSLISDHGLKPVFLINTHCHIDHILGNHDIYTKYQLPLHTSQGEWDVYEQNRQWGKVYDINCDPAPNQVIIIKEGDTISLGSSMFQIISCPGHSPDGICIYQPESNFLVSGDVLFEGSIGRTDLPGGNHDLLLKNIKEKLYILPDETLIFSGHGAITSIGHEKKYNPFVRA